MRIAVVFLFIIFIPFASALCNDNDGDGYGLGDCPLVGEDCRDYDNGVFPGALEVCNGVDDNCDGIVDNLGGYTDIERTKCRCTQKIRLTEECNGIDDDCDEAVDENCITVPSSPLGRVSASPAATAHVASPILATKNILVSIMVFIAVLGVLVYAASLYRNPASPEDLAALYHRKGEIAYEGGRFSRAKSCFEKAADIRRRNP